MANEDTHEFKDTGTEDRSDIPDTKVPRTFQNIDRELSEDDLRDQYPQDTGDRSNLPQRKGQSAFQNIDRELSEDDLTNLAVAKLLLGEKDRLEIENIEFKDQLELKNAELSNYQEMFYEADKKVAVLEKDLEEKRKAKICLTVGAVMIGYATNLLESQSSDWSGWITLILGGVLIFFGGIFEKVVKR